MLTCRVHATYFYQIINIYLKKSYWLRKSFWNELFNSNTALAIEDTGFKSPSHK